MTDYSHQFDRDDSMIEHDTEMVAPSLGEVLPRLEAESPRARRLGFILLGAAVLIAAAIYGVLHLMSAPGQVTDDAYVGGDVVSITSRQGGTILAIRADNTQQVRRGQPLIDLDPATEDVALASAEADLGRAARSVRAANSSVDEADAEIAQSKADLSRAEDDYRRRKAAAAEGAVSGEELSHAADTLATARAALNLARAKRAQAASSVAGTSIADNPAVLSAIAAVRRAAISRSYMNIVAPVSGVVTQRTAQLGQRVAAGTPRMAVVPLDTLRVDANFRETQLRDLRVGQPATIRADVYGGKVTYHGRVLGLGAGSGNAFSLLPPQNATGNWIKIVQRVPVRIALDPKGLHRNPLRVGLSVRVSIDTSDRSAPFVAGANPPAGGHEASLTGGPKIDAKIQQIIAENLGRPA